MSYNGWANRRTWNINQVVMNDEACYEAWKKFKHYYGTFTAQNAKATVHGLFMEKAPDGVSVNHRSINWEEIAKAWNEREE
jgi:hypothetical protein